jgi:hypothetical protein
MHYAQAAFADKPFWLDEFSVSRSPRVLEKVRFHT